MDFPKTENGQTGGGAGVVLNRLTPRIFWASPDNATDRPVLGAVAGDRSTIVVDAGNSPAHARAFLRELGRYALPPIRYLFLTHAHWDHVFGTSEFYDLVSLAHIATARKVEGMSRLSWTDEALENRVRAGEEVQFCSDMIKAELPNRDSLKIIAPTVAFEGRMEIDLGDTRCVLEHLGGDHAGDSSIMHILSEGVVFVGDCLYPALYKAEAPYRFETIDGLLDRLLGYRAELYVLGHASAVVSRPAIESWRKLLREFVVRYGNPAWLQHWGEISGVIEGTSI